MSKESLQKVIGIIGGQVALANAIKARVKDCRVGQGHVWKWLNLSKEEVPPAEYVIAISSSVNWSITPHELRPDIYPHPTDGIPKLQEAA
ncbi:MAG: YdaS family helix-turn-helix protein [Gallionella sp.]|jgi:DNA-binding transcriptional regulator YdaS (Cro superfamily)